MLERRPSCFTLYPQATLIPELRARSTEATLAEISVAPREVRQHILKWDDW